MCFSGILLLFLCSSKCWQFDLWFLCLFKRSLYIWQFLIQVLLKPSLKDFEHNFDGMWSEPSCMIVCTSLALPLFGIGMKTDLFQSCGHCWVFHICWHTEYSTLATLSSSSTGILSPPLALFIVMLSKVHLTSHPGKSGSRWVATPSCLLGFVKIFFAQFFCVFLPLLNLFCFC